MSRIFCADKDFLIPSQIVLSSGHFSKSPLMQLTFIFRKKKKKLDVSLPFHVLVMYVHFMFPQLHLLKVLLHEYMGLFLKFSSMYKPNMSALLC